MNQAILIMAKRPEAGQTKTRLCPPFTADEAAQLYECFLKDVTAIVRSVQREHPDVEPFIAYTPKESRSYFEQLAPDFSLVPQVGADLSQRLDGVLTDCLQQGYGRVVAINSDSPDLPVEYLAQAFDRLNDNNVDIVLGPSDDGGYYLIGMSRYWPRLVSDVEMSTANVLRDTLTIAAEAGAAVSLLPEWYDVDTIHDLDRLHSTLRQTPGPLAFYTQLFLHEHRHYHSSPE